MRKYILLSCLLTSSMTTANAQYEKVLNIFTGKFDYVNGKVSTSTYSINFSTDISAPNLTALFNSSGSFVTKQIFHSSMTEIQSINQEQLYNSSATANYLNSNYATMKGYFNIWDAGLTKYGLLWINPSGNIVFNTGSNPAGSGGGILFNPQSGIIDFNNNDAANIKVCEISALNVGTMTASTIYAEDLHVSSITVTIATATAISVEYINAAVSDNVKYNSDINLQNHKIYGGQIIDTGIQVGSTTLQNTKMDNLVGVVVSTTIQDGSILQQDLAIYYTTHAFVWNVGSTDAVTANDIPNQVIDILVPSDIIIKAWYIVENTDTSGSVTISVSSRAFGTSYGIIDGGISVDNTKRPNAVSQPESSGTASGFTTAIVGVNGWIRLKALTVALFKKFSVAILYWRPNK